ncbi:hypothetical protein GQ55_9G380800 [Panicum hallii var. hallii]|uniref:Pentacotripeptide-repeat region of PRORP domain-containing protein n=1 Tax=Panicum hallii var. hallii TaxID=1504633 RepID=A0A2T7C992_9POAL|nr:hypothetical protein GQ55_9G380800 [Panicum hallii var. hallii]
MAQSSSIQRANSQLPEGTPPHRAAANRRRLSAGNGARSILPCRRRCLRPRPLASMLPAALAAAFFASKPRPQRPPQLLTPQLIDSHGLALSFFLWCARRPGYFHPSSSFDRLLPATATRLGTAPALLRELQCLGCPIKPQTFLLLLRLYWRGALYTLVAEVFDQMCLWGFRPNAFAWNVVLDILLREGPSRNGSVRCAPGAQLTSPTPSCSLIAAGRGTQKCCSRDFNQALLLSRLSLLAAIRLEPCPSFCSCFLSLLSQDIGLIRRLILRSDISFDYLVACNSVLSALCKSGFPSEAIQFYIDKIDSRIKPDSYTYVGTLREAIHANYALDSVCYTIVLHGLFRAHMVEEACGLFEQRKQSGIAPNTSTYYNVMFRGLCRTKDLHAVKQYITEMEHADVEMDSISFNAVAVLIKSPRVGSAAAIIGYMLNLGMKSSTKTCSLLAQSIG